MPYINRHDNNYGCFNLWISYSTFKKIVYKNVYRKKLTETKKKQKIKRKSLPKIIFLKET